ncbi:hypothetical protein [Pacificispira sp.]|uniref:hypothetical protein n=1 Tax=Pacificispira sp. TaxID=2888761 RepID=UPI003B51614B
MAYRIFESDRVTTVSASGCVTQNERLAMLRDLAAALQVNPHRTVLVDYSSTQMRCSLEEAHQFGKEIGAALSRFDELSVALFIPQDEQAQKSIDLSVMVARGRGIKIATFTDADQLLEYTALRLAPPDCC